MIHGFAFILASLAGLSAQAASVQPDVTKLLDGRAAYCRESRDIGAKAFAPTAVRATGTADGFTLEVELQHWRCGRVNDQPGWILVSPTEPHLGKTIDGLPVTTHIRDLELVVADPSYRMVRSLELGSDAKSASHLEIEWRDKSGLVELELFLRAHLTAEYDGKTVEIGRVASGAFMIRFQMERTGEHATIRGLEVR